METLLDRLGEHSRQHPARPLLREATDSGWRHLNWGELDVAVARAAAGMPAELRGQAVAPVGDSFVDQVVQALALLHRGAVLGGAPQRFVPGAEQPGLLVRLRGELRGRERAIGALSHAELVRRADVLAARLPGEVRFTTAPWLGLWAALAGDTSLVLGDARSPTWVCSPGQLAAAAPPPSRAGPLAGLVRGVGRAAAFPRVWVVGELPAEARSLTARGVRVDSLPPDLIAGLIASPAGAR